MPRLALKKVRILTHLIVTCASDRLITISNAIVIQLCCNVNAMKASFALIQIFGTSGGKYE